MSANDNLLESINNSNVDGVNKALKEGANPDYICKYNRNFDSVMMLAIKTKNIEIIERLLEENINLKHTNKSGQTALDLLLNQSLYKKKPPQILVKNIIKNVQVRIEREDIIKNVQDRIKQDVHLKTEIIFKFLEKEATTQTLSENQTRGFKGDIIPPDSFPLLVIEAKNYGEFKWNQLALGEEVKQLDEWIRQSQESCESQDKWLLCVKISRQGEFVLWDPTQWQDLTFSKTYKTYKYITAKEFWTNNKDAIKNQSQ